MPTREGSENGIVTVGKIASGMAVLLTERMEMFEVPLGVLRDANWKVVVVSSSHQPCFQDRDHAASQLCGHPGRGRGSKGGL